MMKRNGGVSRTATMSASGWARSSPPTWSRCGQRPRFASSSAVALWSLNDNNRAIEIAVAGPLIANDFPTMLGAAVEGIGLAQVPAPIAAGLVKAGKLVQLLAPFAPMGPGVFLYYPGHRQLMPKLRAFIDHVKSRSKAGNKTKTPRN